MTGFKIITVFCLPLPLRPVSEFQIKSLKYSHIGDFKPIFCSNTKSVECESLLSPPADVQAITST